ncbi:hypothetical protein BDAP_002560 [Binucleata daphniae]
MSNKKKKLLEKYLQKKAKQKTKDSLISQILQIDKERNIENKNTTNVDKVKKKKKSNNNKIDEKMMEKHTTNNTNNNEQIIQNNKQKHDKEEKENIEQEKTNCNDNVDDKTCNKHAENNADAVINVSQQNDWIITKKKNNKITTAGNNIDDEIETIPVLNEYRNTKRNNIFVNRKFEIEKNRQKLQIYYEESNIISLIRQNTVTIIQSSTGTGKSSQIPQFLYENGFCAHRMVGITQPRRLATIAISKRINEELNSTVCNYKIKFEDTTNKNTKIKIMTDGVLLNEMKTDFLLTKYSVIIVDEVHERNANIEILIPLLARIIKVRNESCDELKLVFMSATLDIRYLQEYFNNEICVFKVEQKEYKVVTYYKATTEIDYVQKSYDKIQKILLMEEFCDEPSFNSKIIKNSKNKNNERLPMNIKNDSKSAILVFLPTKDDIYKLKNMLDSSINHIETIPLHSSLTYKDQKKVFEKYNKRKVILATNIAETSITIPDVVFVIDSGRFKYKTNINNASLSYKIDFISKASAEQRSGRAGRTSDGVCYRLYSGKVYQQMFDCTTPELQQTSLDSVTLTLKSLGINNIHNFPFIEKIDEKRIKESLVTLVNLGAVDHNGDLTDLGLRMSKLPVNPRIARLICVNTIHKSETLLIASILATSLETSKTNGNTEYYANSTSDLITKMMIMIDYMNANDKKAFCGNVKLNIKQAEEVIKAYEYLKKITNIDNDKLSKNYSNVDIVEIQKIIFCTFCNNIAIKSGNELYYNSDKVYFSSESCFITGEFVVFEYLVIGKSKTYMKNVTQVEQSWF